VDLQSFKQYFSPQKRLGNNFASVSKLLVRLHPRLRDHAHARERVVIGRIVAIAFTFALVAADARAAEWYVAPGRAAGTGSRQAPFMRIGDGIAAAQPGDVVIVRAGTYREVLQTVRGGRAGAPIVIRAEEERGSVTVTAIGRVLNIAHPYVTIEGLVFDGQYGADDLVRVSSAASNLVLRNLEVRRSSRDLIDMASPEDVLIEGCLIHHALNPIDGRSDAHGITAAAVKNLTVRDTEIHTFSGDGIQIDPGRAAPGWTGVTIEHSRIWLEPLPSVENGFRAGEAPGENAVDTKASPNYARATITIRDTTAWGFRQGSITNMAAFNLKEHIDATLDGVTVYDSEIAFRLRGSGTTGPDIAIRNAVVYDTTTAFRYEDNIQNLRIWNGTIGRGVTRAFQSASSPASVLDVRNLLVLGTLPKEAARASNLGVGEEAFADAAQHDYSLSPASMAIDAGVTIPEVTSDREGTERPQGRGYDVGAYERRETASPERRPVKRPLLD